LLNNNILKYQDIQIIVYRYHNYHIAQLVILEEYQYLQDLDIVIKINKKEYMNQ